MNLLFIDNQGITKSDLQYLHKPVYHLEGHKQYILSIAKLAAKKHNISFPFEKSNPDAIHKFGGLSQPVKYRKKLPTIYSFTQPPIKISNAFRQLPILFSERYGLSLFTMFASGMIPQGPFCKNLKKFDQVLTVTNNEKRFLENHGVKNVHKLGVGIDFDYFKPIKIKKDDKITVLYFGAVSPFKGIDIFYETVKEFKNDKRVEFKVALDLYDKRKSNIATKLKKFRNVQMFGKMNNLRDLIITSDIAFLPFPTMLGNFSIPLTILESMSSGKVVLTTDLPAIKETVSNGKNGFYCNDVPQFVKKLNWLIDNNNKLGKVRMNARNYILKNHNWNKISKDLYKYYDKVI